MASQPNSAAPSPETGHWLAEMAGHNLSPSRWVRQVDGTVQCPIQEIIADMQCLNEEARKIDGHLATILAKLK